MPLQERLGVRSLVGGDGDVACRADFRATKPPSWTPSPSNIPPTASRWPRASCWVRWRWWRWLLFAEAVCLAVSMVSAGVWGPGRVAAQARFCSWYVDCNRRPQTAPLTMPQAAVRGPVRGRQRGARRFHLPPATFGCRFPSSCSSLLLIRRPAAAHQSAIAASIKSRCHSPSLCVCVGPSSRAQR